ncbi:MAG: type II toxin-antitoxin system PemK/MazF family toxin [Anaerolineaceae bacterium]|nr:type II toxin-antitoxin system PemK/MazF family toxin [Anaerolineaceae bacterium]
MNQKEIWLIQLDAGKGAEMQKTRPVVIVNRDELGKLPLRVVVPLTGWREKFQGVPWMVYIEPVPVSGLQKKSAVDTFQIRAVSEERFLRKLGEVSDQVYEQIATRISMIVE